MDGWVLGEGTHLIMMTVLCPMVMEGTFPLGRVTCATFIALVPLLSEMGALQVEIATVCTAVLEYYVLHLLGHVYTILLAVLQAVNGRMKMLPRHMLIDDENETLLTAALLTMYTQSQRTDRRRRNQYGS